MSRDRSRNNHNHKSKRVVLVAYEGENKTEKNYLSNFSGRDKDYIIKPVPGNETDPVNLVKQTVQKVQDLSLDLLEDDKAYCIFDADMKPEKNIVKCVKDAETQDMEFIFPKKQKTKYLYRKKAESYPKSKKNLRVIILVNLLFV